MCVQKDTVGWWDSFINVNIWLNKAVLPFKSCGSSGGRCLRTLTTMSDDKILFPFWRLGTAHTWCIGLNICLLPCTCVLPLLSRPSPVGNKWPFCNCIPLSWFFTLYVCSVRVCFKISTSLLKWSRDPGSGTDDKFILCNIFPRASYSTP